MTQPALELSYPEAISSMRLTISDEQVVVVRMDDHDAYHGFKLNRERARQVRDYLNDFLKASSMVVGSSQP